MVGTIMLVYRHDYVQFSGRTSMKLNGGKAKKKNINYVSTFLAM